jgi:HSP20 family molecular chaperone IbpA
MTGLTIRTPSIMGRNVFDQIFDHFFSDHHTMIKRSTDGYPLTDIYKDSDDNQVIEMALAGFTKNDISITIQENKITIRHDGKVDDTVGSSSNYDVEVKTKPQRRIAKRAFSKTFVDYQNNCNLAESIATFENGLLRIIIPNNVADVPIKIDIK